MADGCNASTWDKGAPATAGERDYRCKLEAFLIAASVTDARPTASRLSERFSTLSEVLSAEPALLANYVGQSGARALQAVQELMIWTLADKLHDRRPMDAADVPRFLKNLIGFRCEEAMVVLFLDSARCLIDHEIVAIGRPDSVEFDQRWILLRAIGRGASGIIIAHNHPSGDPRPSRDDVRLTRRLADVSQALGICLHDHLVVAGGEVRSAMFAS